MNIFWMWEGHELLKAGAEYLRLNALVPQNSYAEAPSPPTVDIVRDGASKEGSKLKWGHKDWGTDFKGLVSFVVVQFLSHVWLFATPWRAAHQLPCPSLSSRACSKSCPLSRWCHPTISPSVIPFSFCLQLFPASGPFPISQLFTSDGQSALMMRRDTKETDPSLSA